MALLADLCAGIPQPELWPPTPPVGRYGLHRLLGSPVRFGCPRRPPQGLHRGEASLQHGEPVQREAGAEAGHHGSYRTERGTTQRCRVVLRRRWLRLLHLPLRPLVRSRVPGSGVRGRGSGGRETTASSLAGKEESSRKEDNSGQGKDGPAGAIAQGGNGR